MRLEWLIKAALSLALLLGVMIAIVAWVPSVVPEELRDVQLVLAERYPIQIPQSPLAPVPTPTLAPTRQSLPEPIIATYYNYGKVLIPMVSANRVTPEPEEPAPSRPESIEGINGVPIDQIVVFPEGMLDHAHEIYARGQSLGRNPAAFAKLGDSTMVAGLFFARFDTDDYDMGDFFYLEPVINTYQGSFARDSAAVRLGLNTWSVLDPLWSDKARCEPNETMLACEFRLHNPSLLFVRLGTNDVGNPDSFERNLRNIVEYSIESGVIPILGTKADRTEGESAINNIIIRSVAVDYAIPLWDYDRVADTLPGRGLSTDGIHMTAYYTHDYRDPTAFERGHAVHNLTALMMLDALWREVIWRYEG